MTELRHDYMHRVRDNDSTFFRVLHVFGLHNHNAEDKGASPFVRNEREVTSSHLDDETARYYWTDRAAVSIRARKLPRAMLFAPSEGDGPALRRLLAEGNRDARRPTVPATSGPIYANNQLQAKERGHTALGTREGQICALPDNREACTSIDMAFPP